LHCVWLIEKRREYSVQRCSQATLNLGNHRLTLTWDPEPGTQAFQSCCRNKRIGYGATPSRADKASEQDCREKPRYLRRLGWGPDVHAGHDRPPWPMYEEFNQDLTADIGDHFCAG